MIRFALTCACCLPDKHYMPKIATKFTADTTIKVGRQRLTVKMPIDLADISGDDAGAVMMEFANTKVRDSMKVSIANLSALKKAHKAYKKAHP